MINLLFFLRKKTFFTKIEFIILLLLLAIMVFFAKQYDILILNITLKILISIFLSFYVWYIGARYFDNFFHSFSFLFLVIPLVFFLISALIWNDIANFLQKLYIDSQSSYPNFVWRDSIFYSLAIQANLFNFWNLNHYFMLNWPFKFIFFLLATLCIYFLLWIEITVYLKFHDELNDYIDLS